MDFVRFNESESTNSITDKFHKKLLLNLVIKNNLGGGWGEREGKCIYGSVHSGLSCLQIQRISSLS